MKKFFDHEQTRLIYVDQFATQTFWDSHWATKDFTPSNRAKSKIADNSTFPSATRKNP